MIRQPWLEFRQGSLGISFIHCFFKENRKERGEREERGEERREKHQCKQVTAIGLLVSHTQA